MAINVYRYGATSFVLSEIIDADINQHHVSSVCVYFATGGEERGTRWEILIEPSSFEKLAAAMMRVDPTRAAKAFGKALQKMPLQTK